jgi:hypothetical protein
MPRYIGYNFTGTANNTVISALSTSSYTSLYLAMDGTNGSTTFTDESSYNHTIAVNAGPVLSTGTKKFGTASCDFGTGSISTSASTAAFGFGTGDFTIEWWQYWDTINGYQTIYDCGYTSAGSILIQTNTGTGKYRVYFQTQKLEETNAASTGQWYHYAIVRRNGTLTIYRNGTNNGSTTAADNVSGNFTTYIGGSSAGYPLVGYVDDFLVLKGIARYTADFTVPTAASTASPILPTPEQKYNSGVWSISNSSGSDYSVYAKRLTSLWPTTSRNNPVVPVDEAPLYAHYVRWDSSEASKINVGSGTWVSSDSGSLGAITLQNMNGSYASQALTYSANTQNGRNVINSPVNRLFRITSGSDATSRSNYSVMMVFSTGASSRVALLFGGNRGFELNGNGGTSANRIDFIGGSGNDRTITQTGIGSSYNIRRVFGVSYDGTAGLHSALAYSSLSGGITLGTSGSNSTGGSGFGGGSAFELGGYSGAGPTITVDDFDFCELIFYSSTLTQLQLDAEGARLKNKWNT